MCLSSMARSLYPIFRRKCDASFHPSPFTFRTNQARISGGGASCAERGENPRAIPLRLEQAPRLRVVKADVVFLPEEDLRRINLGRQKIGLLQAFHHLRRVDGA